MMDRMKNKWMEKNQGQESVFLYSECVSVSQKQWESEIKEKNTKDTTRERVCLDERQKQKKAERPPQTERCSVPAVRKNTSFKVSSLSRTSAGPCQLAKKNSDNPNDLELKAQRDSSHLHQTQHS